MCPYASLFTLICVLLKSIDDYLYQWLVRVPQSLHTRSYQKLYVCLMSAYQCVCHGISSVWWGIENMLYTFRAEMERLIAHKAITSSILLVKMIVFDCMPLCVSVCVCVCVCIYTSECKSHFRQLTALIASSKIQSQSQHYPPFAATHSVWAMCIWKK